MSVNVANIYIKNMKKNVDDYMTLIMDKKANSKVSNALVDAYMESRFYNYANDDNIKNMIFNHLKETSKTLTDYSKDLVIVYLDILNQMYYLDSFYDDVTIKNKANTINNYRIQKLGINEKGFVEKLIKLIKINNTKRDKYLKEFFSPDFKLEIKKTKLNGVYNTLIEHNITFNKLYSDYAINNAFNTGMVKEDKMELYYYLYIPVAISNIIKGDFNKHYLIDFDTDLFTKKKKLIGTLNILNNDSIKEMTSFKITFQDFLNDKNDIYELIRDGYNFAIIIDSTYNDDIVNNTYLQVFKYVIIENEEYKYEDILKLDNVIIL